MVHFLLCFSSYVNQSYKKYVLSTANSKYVQSNAILQSLCQWAPKKSTQKKYGTQAGAVDFWKNNLAAVVKKSGMCCDDGYILEIIVCNWPWVKSHDQMSGHDTMMVVCCRPVYCKEENDFYLKNK